MSRSQTVRLLPDTSSFPLSVKAPKMCGIQRNRNAVGKVLPQRKSLLFLSVVHAVSGGPVPASGHSDIPWILVLFLSTREEKATFSNGYTSLPSNLIYLSLSVSLSLSLFSEMI